MKKTFEYVEVGDKVNRMLAGSLMMLLQVSEITDDQILCGPWVFDRKTGHEVDDVIPTLVSHLVHTCTHH